MGRGHDVLKTRDFATNNEVAALVRAFENATIPASEFTHAAHIAVALSYLDTFPPEQALERMRENIRSFAAHHHVTNLYHETLATFWIRLLNMSPACVMSTTGQSAVRSKPITRAS